MTLSIVVAMALDRAIGKDNKLLWRLSDDLKRFKELTTGHAILMGRRTYESLPTGALPNRRNVVISRTLTSLPDAEVFPSMDEAIKALCEQEEEVFVIGGGKIYSSILDRADRIYLTQVEAHFPDADTFFPQINQTEWVELSREEFPQDERNEYPSTLVILSRKK